MSIPRFIYPNLVLGSGVVISASSEEPGLPAANLLDQARGKPWRSLTGWTIVPGLNDEVHFIAGSTDPGRIGHITLGTYTSGTSFAAWLTAARAAAGVSPKSLGATGWWRADSVTVDSSGLVSQMTDLSGNARHMVQATVGSRPLWVANAVDSRPGLYYDGVTTQLVATSATMTSLLGANGVGTIVLVFRLDSDATGADWLCFAGGGSEFLVFQWTSGLNFAAIAYDTSSKVATDAAVAGVASWHAGWWFYNQASLSASVDDADSAAFTNTVMTGALHASIMGSTFKLGGSGVPFKGYLLECMIFPTALSEENRRRITAYIKGRYPSVAANDTTTAPTWTDVLTDTYAATTKKFTVTRTAGAGNATLYSDNTLGGFASMLAMKDEGFTVAANKTGAATYTAEGVSYQGRHFVKVDLLTAMAATAGIALDHNGGAGGTYTQEGNANNLWISPTLSQTLVGDTTTRLKYWASSSQRWWRLVIEDVQNSAGYAEVGVWSLGLYVAPSFCHTQDFNKLLEPLSGIGYGTHGSHYQDSRPTRWVWNLNWSEVPDADRVLFEALVDFLDVGDNFFVAWDASITPTDIWYVFRREAFTVAMATPFPYWNIPLQLVQVLP